jgi:hypothetical protein
LIKTLAITEGEYLNFKEYPFAVLNTSARIKNTTEEYDLLISDTSFNTGGHAEYLGDTLIVLNNELHNCHIIKRSRGMAMTTFYYISSVLNFPLIILEGDNRNEIESMEIITRYEKNSVQGKKYMDRKEMQLRLTGTRED